MGYIAYTDPDYKTPYLINPITVGDMSVADSSNWNAWAFTVGDVQCHETNASDVFIDYSGITGDMLMPSVTLYFKNGWQLTLTYEKINTYQAGLTAFAQVTCNGTAYNGITATRSYSNPSDNPKCGFIFVKNNTYVAGTPHSTIGVVFGWFNSGVFESDFIPRMISREAFEADQTDPSGGIPIQPEGGDGKYTLHAETLNFGTAEGRSDDMGGGGLAAGTAHGTHLYDLDLTAFSDFMGTAYAGTSSLSFSDLWQAYKNSMHDPLSGILGALIIPINPPSTAVTYIRLSGQSLAVSGSCGYVSKRFGETSEASVSLADTYYDTFLDFEPFTKITLYLPFVGSVGVNTNECMGGSISVKYWVDYCTGNCVAYVTLTDRFGKPSYYQYSGNCAAYIPVSGNDAGISSIISGASSVITGTVQAMSGNPVGIGSMIGGGLQIAEPKTTQKHVGGFSGGSGCVGCLYPYIVINHPSAATDDGYTGIMGAPSGLNGTVGQYSGFTAFMHADTHGIPCTAEEMQEIESALAEGVYL